MGNSDIWDDDRENDAWRVVDQWIPVFGDCLPTQLELHDFLNPPIYSKIATGFVQKQRSEKTWRFLTSDQLMAIAAKVESAEVDIDVMPGVYMFVCLDDRSVLKVGQTSDLRRRIAREHLRKASMNTDSVLIDFVLRSWDHPSHERWFEALGSYEVNAFMFPMRKSTDTDRKMIEMSLAEMVVPTMP